MSSQLLTLAQIIATGVQDIQSQCAARGVAYPQMDERLTAESEAIVNECAAQVAPIVAAAQQLVATLQHPSPYLTNMAFGVGTETIDIE